MLYVCAGMTRSGSTWVYNAVRMLLEKAGCPDLAAGWIAEKEKLLTHRNAVVKTHAFDDGLAGGADVVLVSHRDLRDVVASLHRMFQMEVSVTTVRGAYLNYVKWAEIAAYDLHYEHLLTNKLSELRAIAAVLKLSPPTLENLPYETILREIDRQAYTAERATELGHDAVNLLHHGHITDGRHRSWENCVPGEIVASIEEEFRDWMVAKGYLAPPPGTGV